ncbi:transposase [uncultured Oscillibacter sp.]|uniref:transposase n=1 Tax=uncultured Oscillibacter sp. TaxID=876091 RepID=UPI00345C9509
MIGNSRGGKATKIHAMVECFFLKLKSFRRIAPRYEKLASSFLTFVCLAFSFILLK